MDNENCSGSHRYFVANDASYEGKVYILLVCTACGGHKKIEFQIAPKDATADIK